MSQQTSSCRCLVLRIAQEALVLLELSVLLKKLLRCYSSIMSDLELLLSVLAAPFNIAPPRADIREPDLLHSLLSVALLLICDALYAYGLTNLLVATNRTRAPSGTACGSFFAFWA